MSRKNNANTISYQVRMHLVPGVLSRVRLRNASYVNDHTEHGLLHKSLLPRVNGTAFLHETSLFATSAFWFSDFRVTHASIPRVHDNTKMVTLHLNVQCRAADTACTKSVIVRELRRLFGDARLRDPIGKEHPDGGTPMRVYIHDNEYLEIIAVLSWLSVVVPPPGVRHESAAPGASMAPVSVLMSPVKLHAPRPTVVTKPWWFSPAYTFVARMLGGGRAQRREAANDHRRHDWAWGVKRTFRLF